MIRKFLSLLEVYDTPFTKIRLGNESDGGYVVLKELAEKADRLYSFGVSDDISFEYDLLDLNQNCSIKLFDHTVDGFSSLPYQMVFVKQGVAAKQLPKDFSTLRQLASEQNNSILKMDVEWAEWDVLLSVSDKDIMDFDQIIIELHIVPAIYGNREHTPYFTRFHSTVYSGFNAWIFAKYVEVLEKLLQHYRIFHIHANNSLSPVEIDSLEVPPLLEVSLVNKKHVPNAQRSTSELPVSGLDFPNKSHKPEILFYPFALHRDRGMVNV